MDNEVLKVKNLTVIKNEHKILENINFSVTKGETVAIIGPNGAGKTTLFKAILGLIPYDGEVKWRDGIKLGYVPQKLYVDQDVPLTTREFFELKEKNKSKIMDALYSVGFEKDAQEHFHDGVKHTHIEKHILDNRMGVLSGGELQRVLIAWSLLGNPDVLLFDEPTSGVDIGSEESIYIMLDRLKKQKNLTIMLISHELEIVYQHATNVVCINKENVCYGPPRKTLTKDTIEKLFGEDVDFYMHDHHK
jgi:zinc transport system ATP-binding protein